MPLGNNFTQEEQVNLLQYPTVPRTISGGEQLTIGDLHANPILLVFFLIKEGLIELEPSKYEELAQKYHDYGDPARSTQELFTEITGLLAAIKIKPEAKDVTIRLIGDEVADRGKNDYFMLLLLKQLQEQSKEQQLNLNLEILFSNHGAEFVKFCKEDYSLMFALGRMGDPSQGSSLTNQQYGLIGCLEQKIISKEEVEDLVTEFYTPRLKLLSYIIDEADPPAIKIYSHAPIGFETLQELAGDFKIPVPGANLQELNIQQLTKVIDQINEKFVQLINKKQVTDLIIDKEQPLCKAIWHRVNKNGSQNRPQSQAGSSIYYVHGHEGGGDPEAGKEAYVTNLDGVLGKGDLEPGSYKIERVPVTDYQLVKTPAQPAPTSPRPQPIPVPPQPIPTGDAALDVASSSSKVTPPQLTFITPTPPQPIPAPQPAPVPPQPKPEPPDPAPTPPKHPRSSSSLLASNLRPFKELTRKDKISLIKAEHQKNIELYNKISNIKFVPIELKKINYADQNPTIGKIESTALKNPDGKPIELANIQLNSIACPLQPLPDTTIGLLDEQQQLFLTFLTQKCLEAKASNKTITVQINNFAPDNLRVFLEQAKNLTNVQFRLPAICQYLDANGNNATYTPKQLSFFQKEISACNNYINSQQLQQAGVNLKELRRQTTDLSKKKQKEIRITHVEKLKALAEIVSKPQEPETLLEADVTRNLQQVLPLLYDKEECAVDFKNLDSIAAARKLQEEGCEKPLIIDLANRHFIGGGWENGDSAQEESLFYQTNLHKSLYANPNVPSADGRCRSQEPIPHTAAIYSKDITVLYEGKDPDYKELPEDRRFNIDVLAIAGYDLGAKNRDPSKPENILGKLSSTDIWENMLKQAYKPEQAPDFNDLKETFIQLNKEKIELIFKIALFQGNDSLVLGSISCGTFQFQPDPASKISETWTVDCVTQAYCQAFENLKEQGILQKFKQITFAVTGRDDDPNVTAFKKLANSLGKAKAAPPAHGP